LSASPYSGASTRKNLVAFLLGKIPTALLTATILAMSARALDAEQFGRDVLVMAAVEFTLGMSTLGLDWILLRYLPVFRVHGHRSGLMKLLAGVAGGRALVLGALGAIFALGGSALHKAGLPLPVDLYPMFATLLLVEGVMRIFRDNALEAMAMQGKLQFIVMVKNVTLLSALGWMLHSGAGSTIDLLRAEVAAATLGMLLSLFVIVSTVRRMVPQSAPWQQPTRRQMLSTATMNYASGIVEYMYSPSFLMLLLAKVLPPSHIAGMGFVLRLTDLVRNYLPGMLVFGVVRARMIGSFTLDRNYENLRSWAQFLYKVSLLTLLPVIGIVIVFGADLLRLASGGRYAEYHPVFAALICWLALRLHRNILNVVFNAVELMHLWVRVSMVSLLVLPVLWLAAQRFGPWFVVVALYGNELIINCAAVWQLRRRGYAWPVLRGWVLRATFALMLICAAGFALPSATVPAMVGAACAMMCLYVVAAFVLRVLDLEDRQLMNRTLGRQLFKL
jgi:O-antigen/teichoic acid export membrane protein